MTAIPVDLQHQRLSDNNFAIMRMIAAAVVLIYHNFVLTGHPDADFIRILTGDKESGSIAVDVFFIISGFLISASWDRSDSYVHFAFHRILRIFPAMVFVVVAMGIIIGPLLSTYPSRQYFSDGSLPVYLRTCFPFPVSYKLPGVFSLNTYPDAVNGSLWTIPYEMICYLTTPLLMLESIRGRLIVGYVVAIIMNQLLQDQRIAGALPAALLVPLPGLSLVTFAHFFVFYISGAMLYQNFAFIRTSTGSLAMLAMLAILLWVLGIDHELSLELILPIGVVLVAYSFPVVRVPERVGDLSYGMYIWAFPIAQILISLGMTEIVLHQFSTLFLTLGMALLSWRFIEKPAMDLRRNAFCLRLARYLSAKASA